MSFEAVLNACSDTMFRPGLQHHGAVWLLPPGPDEATRVLLVLGADTVQAKALGLDICRRLDQH